MIRLQYVRALEVWQLTGRPLSAHHGQRVVPENLGNLEYDLSWLDPTSNVTYTAPTESGDAESITDPGTAPSSVPRVGRNDPCPCGSGKKYKKCHGA